MSQNIILLLGAGPNVGQSVVQFFKEKGYKTAAVARNPSPELSALCDVVLKGDFEDPSCIESIFAEVKEKIGIPNVVVYNAYAFPKDATTSAFLPPFVVPLPVFTAALNVNLVTSYMAMQHAIQGFHTLPNDVLKTFIYTGNAAPHIAIPAFMQLTLGKRGGAHVIECAGKVHADDGFRFYFGDERQADASPQYGNLSGEAHAEHYYQLATQKEIGPWEQTFVKGTGYVDFEGNVGEIPKRE